MSEYWKSTPRYWCKHCKTFVRDTKLEKQNHEATPKHQGSLQRFIRDLHRGHEREEREKQRAKDEVNRLNGVFNGSKAVDGHLASRQPPDQARSDIRRGVNPNERKRQLAQLAEMGVAVPEDYRREMAMAGDWQTLSVTPIQRAAETRDEEADDTKPPNIVFGVRKRKLNEAEQEEEEESERVIRRGWGSTTRIYPSAGIDIGEDLDALLMSTNTLKPKFEEKDGSTLLSSTGEGSKLNEKAPLVKEEPDVKEIGHIGELSDRGEHRPNLAGAPIKDEAEDAAPGVVFKKRKLKARSNG